ncbi:MAG: alpha/beta hydrolase [Alphaproteobacteria bacterium]
MTREASLLVLVHGWGFDGGFWQPLCRHLPGVETLTLDLGFRGSPHLPEVPEGRPVIVVGHSTGVLWLLHRRPFRWDGLVAINGFSRFVAGDGFPEGVPPRMVERMLSRFDRDPAAVTAEFLGRCGHGEAVGPLAPAVLRQGLEWLLTWDERAVLAADPRPVLALAGRADPIVPAVMAERCFVGRPMHWHEGGHLLPLTAPEWCAGHIRAVLEGTPLTQPSPPGRGGRRLFGSALEGTGS